MGTDIRKGKLFLELANPDNNGKTNWIDVQNLPDKYQELYSNNGYSWCRNKSQLNKDFIVEKQYSGKKLSKVRLNGKRKNDESI